MKSERFYGGKDRGLWELCFINKKRSNTSKHLDFFLGQIPGCRPTQLISLAPLIPSSMGLNWHGIEFFFIIDYNTPDFGIVKMN